MKRAEINAAETLYVGRRLRPWEFSCHPGSGLEVTRDAFELDEVARQKAKEAAAAAKATAQTDDGEALEHVMLSYNWDHQDVIKRINTSLKGRGYVVWIDIEKMQGRRWRRWRTRWRTRRWCATASRTRTRRA